MTFQFVNNDTMFRWRYIRPTTIAITNGTFPTTRWTGTTFYIRNTTNDIILRRNKLRYPMTNLFYLVTRLNRRIVTGTVTSRLLARMGARLNGTTMTPTQIRPTRHHPPNSRTINRRCRSTFFYIKDVPHEVQQANNLGDNVFYDGTLRVGSKGDTPIFQLRKPSLSFTRVSVPTRDT